MLPIWLNVVEKLFPFELGSRKPNKYWLHSWHFYHNHATNSSIPRQMCRTKSHQRAIEIIMAIHCMTMFLPTPLCLGASRDWCLGHDIPGLSRTVQSPESKLPSVGTGAGNSTKLQRRKNDQLIQYDSNCSELASLLLLVWWYINTTYWETEKLRNRVKEMLAFCRTILI